MKKVIFSYSIVGDLCFCEFLKRNKAKQGYQSGRL